MTTYESKVAAFAESKLLQRLPRPVRDRADAMCDVCGSTQPRLLYGLKDLRSGSYYFVGQTCFQELSKRGVVQRRFGQESGQAIYETHRQPDTKTPSAGHFPEDRIAPQFGTTVAELHSCPLKEGQVLPVIRIVERPELYEITVALFSRKGHCGSGFALVERFEASWHMEDGVTLPRS